MDKIANAYWKWSKTYEYLNLLAWLRVVDHTRKNAKEYSSGSILVGTKLLSIFNQQHFFQYTFLNLPHRNNAELQHPKHQMLPDTLKWYAQAVLHFPNLWNNHDNLRSHLHIFGHKKNFITTVIVYVQSLSDLLYMFRMSLIKATSLITVQSPRKSEMPLKMLSRAKCYQNAH